MATIRTSVLTGIALDYAVMLCEYPHNSLEFFLEMRNRHQLLGRRTGKFRYSERWDQGGPIIERESICIDKFVSGVWSACHRPTDGLIFAASNALTAAMRVYVISKLGGTVEIPDQLLK